MIRGALIDFTRHAPAPPGVVVNNADKGPLGGESLGDFFADISPRARHNGYFILQFHKVSLPQ
jgi:hypothetical protein